MPAALPLIAGAFLAAGSVATAVGLGSLVIAGLAISWAAVLTITGVALLAVSYLARKTPKPESAGSQLQQKLDPQAGVPIAFGRTATGGTITDRLTWGAKNAFYGIVTVLSAGGPIAGIEAYRAGDYPITFAGNPTYSTATVANVGGYSGSSKLYKNKLRQRWQNGDAPAATTPAGASGFPMRGGALSGLAHAITSYEYSTDAFPQGLPASMWTLRGVRLYDPRQDSTYPGGSGAQRVDQPATWTYSENPYVAALQWTLGRYENGHRVYGIGAKWSEVDVASFVNGANVADANGWKIGGVVTTLDDKYAVLASMLSAGGGVPVARGAQIAVSVNAPKTSVLTLTAADIIGEVEMSSSTSFRDRQNTIIPRYREESQNWEIISGERVSAAQYVTEDAGETKSVEIEFPLVQQAAQAHQLAAYELVNSREFLTFTVRAKQRLLAARVGDCINVTVPDIASRFTKCLVAGREFNPADMSVTLTLKSETDAKHAFALGQTQEAPPSAKLDGYDPSNPGAPAATAWAITGTQITNGTTTLPVIVLNGACDDPNASTVIVEYRPTGSSAWLNYGEFPRTTTRIEVSGLTDGTAYEVALSYRTVRGVIGNQLVLSATAGAFKVDWETVVTGPNKPANNADRTADNVSRDTANVGGRPSSSVIIGIDNLRTEVDRALDAAQAQADKEIAAATPPASVSNITWANVLTDAGADVTLTWTAASGATSYEVEISENGGGAIVFAAPSNSYRFAGKRNVSYVVKVRALKVNVAGAWSALLSFTTGRDTVGPAPFTIDSLDTSYRGTFVNLTTPADADLARVEIHVVRVSDGVYVARNSVPASPSSNVTVPISNLAPATTYVVGGLAFDTSENASTGVPAQSFVTAVGVAAGDLTPDASVIKTVTALPATATDSKFVFYNNSLYRWIGSTWTKSVDGGDITSGTITGAAIAPQTLGEEKLVPASITATSLAPLAVTGDKIATKTIAGDKIVDATIGATQIMNGGVGTQQLAPNSVVRDKIAEAAIDASRLQNGAVGTQQLAPGAVTTSNVAPQAIVNTHIADRAVANTNLQDGAVTARTLAVGNFDNVIPDGDMRDTSFWNNRIEGGSFNISLRDQNGYWKFARQMRVDPGTFTGAYSRFFPIEIGATYKLTYSIWVSPDFNGWFSVFLHQPGVRWLSIRPGFDNDITTPSYDGAWSFHNGDSRTDEVVKIFNVPNETNNLTRQTQFRFDGSWTAGYIEFMVKIVRVSDTTLIKDGAITTDKIVANAITGDKIAANQIAANKLQIQSRPVSTVALNIRVDNDNAVRWNAGSVMYVDDNGAFTTYNVSAGGTYWSSGWGSAILHIFYNTATKPSYLDIAIGNAPFDDPRCIVLASWSNNTNLVVYSGTGTLINGGQIVTGSIKADQIQTGAITIGSDGRLGGAGSGQVTIGGLGYSGDLNATRGAPAGTMIGNTEAQTVTNWAYAGQRDPVDRINKFETTTINGGRITTGTVTANEIAANTITTNKLTIGDFTNFAEDFDFALGGKGWELQQNNGRAPRIASATEIGAANTYRGSGNAGYLGEGEGGFRNRGLMRVSPGDKLYGYIWGHLTNGANGNYAIARISYLNPAGVELTVDGGNGLPGIGNHPDTGGWQKSEVFGTVPANAAFARVECFSGVYNGELFLGAAGLMRRATGELIVDGSITATKIAAGSISADKIQTGAITIGSDGRMGGAGSGQVTIGGLGYTGDLNATVGAPAGTNVGNTEAQQVTNWAYTGQRDPADRINKGETTTINGGRITTGTVTANEIAANTITGANVAANTISTKNFLIGDTTNFAENPTFSGGLSGWNDNSGFGLSTNPGTAYKGNNSAYLGGNSGVLRNNALMKVAKGDQLLAFAYINQTGSSGPNGMSYVRMSGVDVNGNEIWATVGQRVNGYTGTYQGYQRVINIETVPDSVVGVRVEVVAYKDSGDVYVGMVGLMRRMTGELIVDGAITADKIAANSINANKLSIATRPISTIGLNFRVAVNGNLEWDGGGVQYTDNSGNYVYQSVAGNFWSTGNGGEYWYIFCNPGSENLMVVSDTSYLAHPNYIRLATWQRSTGILSVNAGVATLINGDKIVTGSINANRIVAGSITADRLAANSITADRLASNAITANKLVAQSRPLSIIGLNMRVDADGVLRWDGGTASFQQDDGSFNTRDLAAGAYGWGGTRVWFYLYVGNDAGNTNLDTQTGYNPPPLSSNGVYKLVATWNGGSDLTVHVGAGTSINGDRIVTGTLNASRIVAGTITGDKLVVGTISAAQIASNAITATKLAIGNPDNIIPDGNMQDVGFWNGANGSVESGNPAGFVAVEDQNANWKFNRRMMIGAGNAIWYTPFFPVEIGATYKVSYSVWTSPDFSGWINVALHLPGIAWWTPKVGYGVDPSQDGNHAFHNGDNTGGTIIDRILTIPNEANNSTKRSQFRFDGHITAGYMEYMVKIVRVSDTTLIQDGAITTDKITVNSLNGDRISVGTLDANRIVANSVMSGNVYVSSSVGTQALDTVATRAANPAQRVNESSTQIDPGRILISGATSLASWRNGGDNTKIEGGSIAANTISANKLTIGNRGISWIGLNFEWNPSNNWISWSEGYVYYQDDNGNARAQYVSAGNTGGANSHRFFYWIKDQNAIYHTQSEQEAFGGTDRVMMGSWWGGSNLNMTYGGTIINGDHITTGTVNADRIMAGTVLASSVIIGGVSGANTVADAFKRADYANVSGAGKPETYTVMARGNQVATLPANYQHGMRGSSGNVFIDTLGSDLRSDNYGRSYTLMWRISADYWAIRLYDVYGNSHPFTDDVGESGAQAMANRIAGLPNGTPVVIFTSDEPGQGRMSAGLPEQMYACGASRSVFGATNWTGWDSYILIGTKGIGEGNGIERYKAGGSESFVSAAFSIVNGVVQGSGKTLTSAKQLRFGDGRVVDELHTVQAGATVGAPAGTYIGNTEAQTVANNAYTGARDPAQRINAYETTTINGGRITTGSITADQIAAYSISADRLVANSIGAGQIAAGSISGDKIAANTITAAQLSTGQLITQSSQIGDATITNAKIANLSVDSLKIAGSAVGQRVVYITNTSISIAYS